MGDVRPRLPVGQFKRAAVTRHTCLQARACPACVEKPTEPGAGALAQRVIAA